MGFHGGWESWYFNQGVVIFDNVYPRLYIGPINNNEVGVVPIVNSAKSFSKSLIYSPTSQTWQLGGNIKVLTGDTDYYLPASAGTTGQILVSQGPNQPPIWLNQTNGTIYDINIEPNSTTVVEISGIATFDKIIIDLYDVAPSTGSPDIIIECGYSANGTEYWLTTGSQYTYTLAAITSGVFGTALYENRNFWLVAQSVNSNSSTRLANSVTGQVIIYNTSFAPRMFSHVGYHVPGNNYGWSDYRVTGRLKQSYSYNKLRFRWDGNQTFALGRFVVKIG